MDRVGKEVSRIVGPEVGLAALDMVNRDVREHVREGERMVDALRQTHRLVAEGERPVVMAEVGHSDPKVTLGIYNPDEDKQRDGRFVRRPVEGPRAGRYACFAMGPGGRMMVRGFDGQVILYTWGGQEKAFAWYDRVYDQGIEDTLHREPATGKIREAIGWQTTRDLDRTIADVIEHSRAREPVGEERAGSL
jgi:hypothetical protein